MTNWNELRAYLLSSLDAEEKTHRLISVTLTLPDGRTHTTLVSSAEDQQGNPWVSIDSIVAAINGVDLLRAARLVGDNACGGLATLPVGEVEYLVVRHAMPISDLNGQNMDGFLVPFYSVTGGASGLAKELSSFNSL